MSLAHFSQNLGKIGMNKQKAIFLDRDNTLNKSVSEVTYKVEDLELMPGVIEGLTLFQDAGYKLYIVTNQSGIARGDFTKKQFAEFTYALHELLEENGIFIEGAAFCPHNRDAGCECRKPKPAMILNLIEDHDLNPKQCWMIGDRETDVQAGLAAGTRALRIGPIEYETYSGKEAYTEFATLLEAAQYILKCQG